MNTPGQAASPADILAQLNALAAELSARGWTTRLHTPRGRAPSLHTRNPEPGASALAEHIYARTDDDGTWTYLWPWAEPIASAPADAAAIIVRVLRSTTAP